MKKLILILALVLSPLILIGQHSTFKDITVTDTLFVGEDGEAKLFRSNDSIFLVIQGDTTILTIDGLVISRTTTADSYTNNIITEWTAGDNMAAGGSNGIYSIAHPDKDVQNTYSLRGRMDLRDATEAIDVNQLHAIDALININETQNYTVTDNISVVGVAVHGGTSGDIVDGYVPGVKPAGTMNLFYGVWGPTADQDLDVVTNGLMLVAHDDTYLDYGMSFFNSGAATAGLYLLNHATGSPATMTSGILMESAANKMTYGVNMSGAGISTAEIIGQNSATIDNAETDTLTLTETVVQVDGILNIIDLKTSTTTVLTPTSTGNVDTLETSIASDIVFSTLTANILEANGTIDGFQSDGTTSLYYHEHNIAALSSSPGASGATLTAPSANTLGGYQLDAVGEQLYFYQHVESDWDGATDLTVEVIWEVNEASSADGTVDLQLIAYYKGDLETTNKTQTSEVPVTITGNKAQFTQHSTTFTIDWDKTSHVVEVGDVIGFILNLETDTSECDDIIVNHMISRYSTTKPAPQTD